MTTTMDAMRQFDQLVAEASSRVAPERAQDLVTVLTKLSLETTTIVDGPARFVAMTGSQPDVRVSAAGLASIWCVAHVAMSFADAVMKVRTTVEGQAADFVLIYSDPSFAGMLDYARSLFHRDQPWPEEIIVPSPQAATPLEGRVNDVFLAATGWVVLHEIGHLHHQHRSAATGHAGRQQEEEADAFAFDWIFTRCPEASRDSRVLAVAVAMAWLFLHHQTIKGPGGFHPHAIIRLWHAQSKFGVGADSYALEAATYLFKAIFDPQSDDMPPGMGAGQSFDWMVARLEKIFPRTF